MTNTPFINLLEKEPDPDAVPYIYELQPTDEIGLSISPSGGRVVTGYELVATQGVGYDLIYEEISNIGEVCVESLIVPEGGLKVGSKYKAIVVNESKDWETGLLDDWDVELVEL